MNRLRIVITATLPGTDPDTAVNTYSREGGNNNPKMLSYNDALEYFNRRKNALEYVLEDEYIPMSEKDARSYRLLVKEMEDVMTLNDRVALTRFVMDKILKIKCDVDEYANAHFDTNFSYLYSSPKCYQKDFKETGVEAVFSSPFILLDGTRSYTARKSDIDWSAMHLDHYDTNKRLWEVCVDGEEAQTEQEREWTEQMAFHTEYFSRFDGKEDFAFRSTAFTAYALIDEYEKGKFCPYHMKRSNCEQWERKFYDTFIDRLDDEKILTIYEAVTD